MQLLKHEFAMSNKSLTNFQIIIIKKKKKIKLAVLPC